MYLADTCDQLRSY